VKFAKELKEPAFAAREVLADMDARTLARELLTMTLEEFSAAFKNSPMKRAKRRGLARNAAVALGNVGTVATHASTARLFLAPSRARADAASATRAARSR
jgi:epoxyqueuosine reductase QueG